jgi:Flp pilus assembly protein protease CpaA
MSFEQIILHSGLLVILLIAAVQDIRRREVSNWITIPLFGAGVLGILISSNLVSIVVAVAVVAASSMSGGYGAADAKIMVGLIWLWPQTVPLTLLIMFAFDLYWRKCRQGSFAPLVVAILGGAVLTFAGEIEFFHCLT